MVLRRLARSTVLRQPPNSVNARFQRGLALPDRESQSFSLCEGRSGFRSVVALLLVSPRLPGEPAQELVGGASRVLCVGIVI
jgi:hypothetical protein